jgi:allantoinase
VVPYTLDCNDMRFVQPQGFSTGDHFFTYLRDAFDALYAEGDRSAPHDEHRHALPAAGPPGASALQRFLDHIAAHDRVWVCRRIDIARHWKQVHPFDAATAFTWPIWEMMHACPDAATDQRRRPGRAS